jgi:hypothetical protein
MRSQSEEVEKCENNLKELGIRNIARVSQPANIEQYGYAITTFFAFFGGFFFYAAFISKIAPDFGNSVIIFFKNDYYFCYLVPLAIIPSYLIIYLNWLAMRHFEQN